MTESTRRTPFTQREKRAAVVQEIKQDPSKCNLFPLAFAQEPMWFLEKVAPRKSNYNMPAAIDFRGTLDVSALEASLNAVVKRHEALRTAFIDLEGVPMQLIQPPEPVVLERIDLSYLDARTVSEERDRLTQEEACRPFELTKGYLFRSTLLKLRADHHLLLVTLHHIVCDDWSLGVLIREISETYRGSFQADRGLELPPLQAVDFACWQREWLQGINLDRLLRYWRSKLSGVPDLLALPLDRPRPATQTFRGARQTFVLTENLTRRLAQVGRQRNATLFMVLLAAFKALLLRYSSQTDIVVGTPIANRNTVELEASIGLFFNTLVLRSDLSGDPSFLDLLAHEREVTLDAYAHQDLPFVKIVEAVKPGRALSHSPVVQAMFILQNAPRELFELPGLSVQICEVDNHTAQLDLIMSLRQTNNGLTGYAHYNTDIFEASTISRLIGHFCTLLRSVVETPAARLSMLKVLTRQEWQNVVSTWNNTIVHVPNGLTLHGLFETQAARQPNAIAVICGDRQLTYADLNAHANRLANHLIRMGAKPGSNIGLFLPPSQQMLVGLLAVLKTGSAYVPIDPNQPVERCAFMAEDARVTMLVTLESLRPKVPRGVMPVVCMDTEDSMVASCPSISPSVPVHGEHLAYVIYTSGTTGRPKGVMIRHAGIVNNLLDLNRSFHVAANDRVISLSAFSFDMSVYETLGIFSAGGTVVIPQHDQLRDPAHWVELILRHRVTIWNSAPSLLEMLINHTLSTGVKLPKLRVAILGGDRVALTLPDQLAQVAPEAKLAVLGGATEASIHSTIFSVESVDPAWISIPYGRPMHNQSAYLLDPQMNPVPVGVPGELYLGGAGLARGYYAKPALTGDRFVPDPFGTCGGRLYRTGDVARYREDGVLILVGRMDHQVKIRGYRIEPGEIEFVICEHPAVRQAVVTAVCDARGEKHLVAYLVLKRMASLDEIALYTRDRLPSYMVPNQYILLETLPLSPNGKVDRRALPLPMPAATTESADMSPLEEVIASMFSEVLGVSSVGPQDNFFDLGGHSLRATQLVSRVRDFLQVELPLPTFLQDPNVAAVASLVEHIATERGVQLHELVLTLREICDMTEEEVKINLADRANTNP